ncbi:MAG TPA: adenylate/guanylate cyclase domain-containing protein [Stellaceae bacterium]|jgi:adenylate cyclase|nr:adenylate/guanylate cyclase domain-containing protein [Stellaceae bacterium]
MTLPFTGKIRLRPTILALFALLTVPIFVAIVSITYVSNEQVARSNADSLIGRFRTDAVQNIQDMLEPIKSLVRSAAVVGEQQTDFYSDNRSLKYLFSILRHSEKLISVYVGLADGSFRQARRMSPAVEVQDKLPPASVKYAYRWIGPPSGAAPVDHYDFLDDNHDNIGTSQQTTTYDPRPREWYRKTAERGSIYITDPEVFAALGLIGFTVAAPIKIDGKIAGVAAADLTLDGLSEYLAESKISPGTTSYILDSQDGVIANSELQKTYTISDGRVQLQHIASLDDKLPAVAFNDRPRNSDRLYSFGYDGKRYVASYTTLPLKFGSRWQLFIITPLEDFTRTLNEHNDKLLIMGMGSIVVEIGLIYFLSAALSRPLEQLALRVGKIEDLSAGEYKPLKSSIREISVLSKAIDTLDSTIKSFAAYVPVSLVRQLLGSDRLELGGHSRFLTIFFSDLEAFSTLSEAVPSQELVTRVSAYLEAVTNAVNDELGTIDKFIGDGVMAFWGAPALLDDHAWHACIAALRICDALNGLNAQWEQQGLKPLNIRIGIHSDAVLVGNIGSRTRMAYTVMGDGVNVASRLEGVNKLYGTRICISQAVFRETGERLCVRPIDDVVVKGRRSNIPIYELLGAHGSDPRFEPNEETLRLVQLTRTAYEALVREDYPFAIARYKEVLAEFPEDSVALEIIRRLASTESAIRVHRQASG